MDNPIPAYIIVYRNIKHPRLEYKTGILTLILPKTYKNPEQILQRYQEWIQSKQQTINKALEEAENKTLIHNRTEEQLRQLIQNLVENYQQELNIKVNKIFFRRMRTKWASYSRNGNITINTLTKYLPQDLITYIVYHETVHAIERKHNKNFWNIINKKFPDYTMKERDLLTYWFKIRKTIQSNK